MTKKMPDYKNYTLGDLFQAREAINKELYPDRLEEIERRIQQKLSNAGALSDDKSKFAALRIKTNEFQTEFREASLENKYKTFWHRFFAIIIDAIVLAILYAILEKGLKSIGWWTIPVAIGFQYFYYLIYSITCHGLYSKTIGKAAMGIVVLDSKSEDKIGFKHSLLRDCVPLIFASVLFAIVMGAYFGNGALSTAMIGLITTMVIFQGIWGISELVTMLFNKKRRAVHDFIAGTVVVRKNI